MKRHFVKKPVTSASIVPSNSVSVDEVLQIVRDHEEFLLETEDAVYLFDPDAAELPGVFKITHDNISQSIATACKEWGDDVTADEIVSDWLYYYATQATIEDLDEAYESVGQEMPEEFIGY